MNWPLIGSVALTLLKRLPWEKIVPLLIQLLEFLFGKGLGEMAALLVAQRDRDRKQAAIKTGAEARNLNVAILKEATQQSKGVPEWVAVMLNELTFVEHIRKYYPARFNEWKGRVEKWQKKGLKLQRASELDPMGLYIPKRKT